ncbi:hypothetical protein WJX72_006539 [[Myrmecia] bisecta]|uniref:Ubiquitin-like domain-containing protein n=1 Tax=[Myrmecia] bisecta TaxID=41462 RepID=A0AAW1R7N6_9CHLO
MVELKVHIGDKVIKVPVQDFQGRPDGWQLLQQHVAKQAVPAGPDAKQVRLCTFAGTTLTDLQSLQQLGLVPKEKELLCGIVIPGCNLDKWIDVDQYMSGVDALSEMVDDAIQACLTSKAPEVELILDAIQEKVVVSDNGSGIGVDEGAVIAELSKSGEAQMLTALRADSEATRNAENRCVRCLQDDGAVAAHGFGLEV